MIDILIYIVLPIIGSTFILYSIFYSMNHIGTNITVGKVKKNLFVWGFIFISIAMALLGNGIINLIFLLFIPVIGHYQYHNSRLYIVYYVGFIIAIYLTDLLTIVVAHFIFTNQIVYFTNDHTYYIVLNITIRFVEFMILKVLVAIIQRKNHERITMRQMISYFILPAFSIVNLFSMMTFLQIYLSEEFLILFAINIALLIGLNIYFTSVFDVISRNNHLENELNLYQQQQTIQVRYYENLEQKYGNTRKLVHDIRNHLQAMERLYENQKNSEGCQYAKDVHDMLNHLGQKYYTSNKMLNIILNDKAQTMQALGITEDIKITEVDLSFLRDVDITTLFANIIDNAIEAADPSVDKIIILRVAKIHDFISITLKNSFAIEPRKKENSFLSTKNNHEGLGLKNVEMVVAKYMGDVQYERRDQYFITRIMLTN